VGTSIQKGSAVSTHKVTLAEQQRLLSIQTWNQPLGRCPAAMLDGKCWPRSAFEALVGA
jgi:hypothetical protein